MNNSFKIVVFLLIIGIVIYSINIDENFIVWNEGLITIYYLFEKIINEN